MGVFIKPGLFVDNKYTVVRDLDVRRDVSRVCRDIHIKFTENIKRRFTMADREDLFFFFDRIMIQEQRQVREHLKKRHKWN